MSERKVFHSSHKEGRWHILLDGKEIAKHETQSECEQDAIARAKKVHDDGGLAQVVFHNEIGGIREEHTYGKDPRKIPG